MKKIKTFINYFICVPYAVSLGAFALYFRYFFTIKLAPNVEITEAVNLVMQRYLKIGLFTLFIGLLLTFAVKISKIIFNEDKDYNSKYPWTNLNNEEENGKVSESEDKFSVENTLEEPKEESSNIEETFDNVSNEDYVINDNPEIDNKITKDLENDNKIKARLIEDDSKSLETLEDEAIVVIPESKKQTIIKVDSSKVKVDGFRHCPKCNNLVVEDAIICIHCGVLLDESIKEKEKEINVNKKKKFNFARLAIDAIIILVSLIIIILLCHKIETQKAENDSNLNTKSTSLQEILTK